MEQDFIIGLLSVLNYKLCPLLVFFLWKIITRDKGCSAYCNYLLGTVVFGVYRSSKSISFEFCTRRRIDTKDTEKPSLARDR